MGPFNLTAEWGTWVSYVVPLLIGVGFGAALEMSGFSDSRKLAAQFYLKEMTVLKVMFTGIIVAGGLIGLSSAFGLLNFEQLFVNPTFLVPGIVGGLVMGVGFIIGGFCPGTSIVASSTLKIDGILFALGVAAGIFAFGETVGLYSDFWWSTAMGRLTLPELVGLDAGVVLVGVVVMALFMFQAAEVSEAFFGRNIPAADLRFLPRKPMAYLFGGSLILLVAITALRGQPDPDRKWDLIAAEAGVQLENRDVYVHPMEVAELTRDTAVYTRVLDVRSEAHFNLFHLRNSRHTALHELRDPEFIKAMKSAPGNRVVFTVSNDEARAARAWKLLVAQGVSNVYIVEGGINGWLGLFPPPPCLARAKKGPHEEDTPAFDFFRSVGDCCNSAYPDVKHRKLPLDCYLASHPGSGAHSKAGTTQAPGQKTEFVRKVKLKKKKSVKGGCG